MKRLKKINPRDGTGIGRKATDAELDEYLNRERKNLLTFRAGKEGTYSALQSETLQQIPIILSTLAFASPYSLTPCA